MLDDIGRVPMNGYERMIQVIREEIGREKNRFPVRLGTMGNEGSCSIGTIQLETDDLLVDEELGKKLRAGDTVVVTEVSDARFAIIAKVVEMKECSLLT